MDSAAPAAVRADAAKAYRARFGQAPLAVAWAPGRVNLLGEHTDYNGGAVLPMALWRGTAVALGAGPTPGVVRLASTAYAKAVTRRVGAPPGGDWADHLFASVLAGAADLATARGLMACAASDLPVGAGLSSSAAIQVASLRACAMMLGTTPDPVQTAKCAHDVETGYVGVPCGIMDQFTASVGTPGEALFLETRSLESRPTRLPPGHSLIIVHSGATHRLADSDYTTRVRECAAACSALNVACLSNLGPADLPRIAVLPTPLAQRARHVITENARTRAGQRALEAGDAVTFGRLMAQSHASARDDYQITIPRTDAIATAMMAAGALGARQTGGGWGGCVIALAPRDAVTAASAAALRACPEATVLGVLDAARA